MKKILVYCQHILGIGHLARIRVILEELQGSEVTLVLGGPETEIVFPDFVHVVQLPALHMDAEFSGLQPVEPGALLEEIKEQRKKQLLELYTVLQPDLLLIELFPFGRCGFRFELDPLLDHVSRQKGRCQVVCSVRDILVERNNRMKFEQRAVERLNGFFDLLLVHADPDVIRLEETFFRMADIRIPVQYTGYVAEKSSAAKGMELRRTLGLAPGEQLIVVSAGSGSVGLPLLESTLTACAILAERENVRVQVFTGPYLDDDEYARLVQSANADTVIERFSDHFVDWLWAADLSISMGGYNTTMNVAAAGSPALIFPFAQNREQRLRAERLTGRLPLQILTQEDLTVERFIKKMTHMLRQTSCFPSIRLDGASEAARFLLTANPGEYGNG